jgi:putative hemolysin
MEFVIIGILIFLNGFFSLSEIALVSSKKSRLEQFMIEGRKGSKTALRLLNDSENFLSAVQVGITFIGILTGVFGGIGIADEFTPVLRQIGLFNDSAHEVALVVTILVITYFSIVLGELVPKTIALSNPEKIAIRIAPIVYYFSIVFYPVVKFLSFSTLLIKNLLGIKKPTDQITESELRHMLKNASRVGVIANDQNLIHEKVFYFSDKKARHIMTHRMEVEWIDLNLPPTQLKDKILKSDHSKLICARESLDNFLGVLLVKDFLLAISTEKSVNVVRLLTQPLIVPENVDANKVLDLVKKNQKHFCVVVNEYGSFEGIITLHDIMESIIGEIPEEGESTEPDIFKRDDNSFLISGDAPVEVLDRIFPNYITDFDNIDYSTVAGFVLSNIKKIPQIGDKFDYAGYTVEIVDIDGKRIDKILIQKKENEVSV